LAYSQVSVVNTDANVAAEISRDFAATVEDALWSEM
jgi:hypothetical protein